MQKLNNKDLAFSERNFLSKILVAMLKLSGIITFLPHNVILNIVKNIDFQNLDENEYQYERRLVYFAEGIISSLFIFTMIFIQVPYLLIVLILRIDPSTIFLFSMGAAAALMMILYIFKYFYLFLLEWRKKPIVAGSFKVSVNNWDLLFFVIPFLAVVISYIV